MITPRAGLSLDRSSHARSAKLEDIETAFTIDKIDQTTFDDVDIVGLRRAKSICRRRQIRRDFLTPDSDVTVSLERFRQAEALLQVLADRNFTRRQTLCLDENCGHDILRNNQDAVFVRQNEIAWIDTHFM